MARLTRKRWNERDEEEEIERRSPWRIDDASKINVNTTKLVPAAFARGYGISVFTNSIDDISSFLSFFFFLAPLPLSSPFPPRSTSIRSSEGERG